MRTETSDPPVETGLRAPRAPGCRRRVARRHTATPRRRADRPSEISRTASSRASAAGMRRPFDGLVAVAAIHPDRAVAVDEDVGDPVVDDSAQHAEFGEAQCSRSALPRSRSRAQAAQSARSSCRTRLDAEDRRRRASRTSERRGTAAPPWGERAPPQQTRCMLRDGSSDLGLVERLITADPEGMAEFGGFYGRARERLAPLLTAGSAAAPHRARRVRSWDSSTPI